MKLASVFSDHAVFQRGIPIPVWGWTKPGIQVRAQLGASTAVTQSGADGRFLVRLPPLEGGGTAYELSVTAGGESVAVKDILIGEVWVASGQSNMEWTLNACGKQGDETIAAATDPHIRFLTVPRTALVGRQSDVAAKWEVSSPETAALFSAVAYHFANELHDRLQVPVGILSTSWGGTFIQTWTSREALVRNPATRAWTERYEATVYRPDYWDEQEAKAVRYPLDPGNEGLARGWAQADYADQEWETMQIPRSWQMGGHNYSGVFWFRLAVDIPEDWAGRDLALQIGAVDKQDTTYFNGVQVGATGTGLEEQHWSAYRNYRVPGKLVKAGRNTIAVRAYSFVFGGGMIGPDSKMMLCPADGRGTAIPLAGEWRYRVEHEFGLVQPTQLPMGPGNANSPYMLHDNMVHPLIPYGIRGAIWYQGESNAGDAGQYRDMMRNLIADWRRAWGQGDFPFLQVQLANFRQSQDYQEESDWARLREAQLQALAEPETGLAVAIDIGEALDIHPKNKREVGRRLAQWALVKTFGQPGVASGPLYSGMTIEGSRIRVRFDHAGAGLMAKAGQPPSHFVIAGNDRTFAPATARIEGATVVVESEQVAEPVAVRYAWADNPEGCNLANRDGFPASPFRTDTW